MERGAPIAGDDLDFARRLAEGDSAAVVAFERRFRPIVRHAFERARSRWRPDAPLEAEDGVQDFVGILLSDGGRRLRSYEGRAAFGTWLYTVALRHFQRAFARARGDRRSAAALTALPDRDGRNPELALMHAEQADRLRQAVHTLGPAEQLFLRLFFVEGLNATEVARTLGQGTSAVRMRKLRLLDRLRSLLGEAAPEADRGAREADAGPLRPPEGGARRAATLALAPRPALGAGAAPADPESPLPASGRRDQSR